MPAHRMRVVARGRARTGLAAAVAAVAAAVVLLLGLVVPAWGVTGSPELRLSPEEGGLGDTVTIDGTGFTPATPSGCELRALDRSWSCVLDGRDGYAALRLGVVPDLSPGEYPVEVCVPGCADPWAGRASGTLRVEEPDGCQDPDGCPDPDVGQDPGDGGTGPVGEAPGDVRLAVAALVTGPGDGSRPRPVAGTVRAVATVDDELTLAPQPAGPTDTVEVVAPAVLSPDAGTRCALMWDGAPADVAELAVTCTADEDGVLRGSLVIPAGAEVGTHVVGACRPTCGDPGARRAEVPLLVDAEVPPDGPDPEPVDVPRVVGLTPDAAGDVLAEARLAVGTISGSGERVVDQAPGAGTSVPVGSEVDLVLGAAPPPPLVTVPSLEGLTVRQAASVLAPLGLVVADVPAGEGTVAEQDPAAGAQVPAGTAVRVRLGAPPAVDVPAPPPSAPTWLWAAGLAVAALLTGAAASAGRSMWRARIPRVVAVPDERPTTTTVVDATSAAEPVLRIRAHADDHPTIVTEVHR